METLKISLHIMWLKTVRKEGKKKIPKKHWSRVRRVLCRQNNWTRFMNGCSFENRFDSIFVRLDGVYFV